MADEYPKRAVKLSAPSLTIRHVPVALEPRTPSSYDLAAGTPDDLRGALVRAGWRVTLTSSEHEHCRLVAGDGLIVVYRSGAVVVQGRDQGRAHDALQQIGGGR